MPTGNERIDAARRSAWDDSRLAAEAVELARELLDSASAALRFSERMQARQLAAMMDDAAGKAFTFAMADQVFRAPGEQRQARRFRDLIDDFGVPAYLPTPARIAMKAGQAASLLAPDLVMPMVANQLRRESASVILPAEPEKLRKHLHQRRRAGMRLNLNQLGEAVLGEGEAGRRLQANLDRLADPDTDYISVKFSAIFSQIHAVGHEETLAALKHRLRLLYRAAMNHRRADGSPKFVNLDMEEYRDLRLTREAFTEVLEEPEFHHLEAGIVLQAYLPDAWPAQRELNAWARQRVGNGGAGIKIRLVKGANLAMEVVEAEIHDWPLAPYGSKAEVDANFKRMVHEGCQPENAACVRLGIASHNLFDIAYGLLLRAREGVEDRVEFEMLEGMANHQARVVRETAGDLLLYAPIVRREDFPSAIAYLVRRLDENTSPENFLHDLFGMKFGDAAWEHQKSRFLAACAAKDATRHGPGRLQNRASESPVAAEVDATFHNAADTDFALPANVGWIRAAVDALRDAPPAEVLLQVGGSSISGPDSGETRDPSRPGVIACHHALAGPAEVERALTCAFDARAGWRALDPEVRAGKLLAAAARLTAVRGEAIATMVREAGKTVAEADVEVSEAVDFANYYARSMMDPAWADGTRFEPLGTVVVTPPWNFPFAIPCGGVLAPLAAGCTVILKPAPETVHSAWVMVSALWDAGIPREVLQFLPTPDNDTGRALVTDPRVDAVVLTGAYETARMFLGWKPELRLFAETSGKNALIITAAADPDLAVKDLVRSAFGHAGQKCSAASLGILEAEVYDDPHFLEKIRDAASSLKAGPAWEFDSVVPPLIHPPGDALRRALTTLDSGESWLLEPRQLADNPGLWSPGIKLGVDPDSWFRRTECFGPVLGLVRARDLDHAIRIQNDSDFGLTGGIHSLDPQEIAIWREKVEVGNAYINRPITGAIVRRQPFGGWKRSCFGPGAKAGGPNYVAQFGRFHDAGECRFRDRPTARVEKLLEAIADPTLRLAAESDAFWMRREFGITHDPSGLRCESNIFRYRPIGRILLLASEPRSLARMTLAAMASSPTVEIEISLPTEYEFPSWTSLFPIWRESVQGMVERLKPGSYGLIRSSGQSPEIAAAAIAAGIRFVAHAPVSNGRIELLPCFREQAVTETSHRHGSILPSLKNLA